MPIWPFQKPPTMPNNGDGVSPENASNTDEHFDANKACAERTNSASTTELVQTAHELRRQYADLLRHRDELANERLEAQQALHQSNAFRRVFRDSQHQLRDYWRDKGGGDEFDQAKFLTLCEQVVADSNTADARALRASISQGKLSSQEFRVRELEAASIEKLRSFLRQTGVWNDAQLDPDQLREEFPAILQQSPSASMNPLLREYYSRAGEVGLLGEELADLDFEYQQVLSLLALRHDQGNPSSESESHHEPKYKATRVEVEKRLGDAIAAAEESKAQCILAGLDPEALLPHTSLDGFMLPEPLFMARTQERQDTSAHILAGTAHAPQPDAADSKQAMVLEWATKVTAVDEEPAVPCITTEEILAMNQRQLDKWGHQIIQRPRRHSSESHLRWKGNESHKELMYS